MSEVSASRALERGIDGIKKIPRGCVTGCFVTPFSMLYKARYAIALLLIASIEGHQAPFRPEATEIRSSSAVSAISSGIEGYGLPTRELDPGALGYLSQRFFQFQDSNVPLDGSLREISDSLPPESVVKRYWSTAEKEGISDVSSETEIIVVNLGMWSLNDIRTLYILPDHRVLCR